MKCKSCHKDITGREMIDAIRTGGEMCYHCYGQGKTHFSEELKKLKARKPEYFNETNKQGA